VSGGIQERITGFWSNIAEGYEAHPGNVPRRDSAEFKAWVAALTKLLPRAPADILDIATGTGFVAMIAAALGHRVTAIDLSDPMLAVARAEAQRRGLTIDFRHADAVSPTLAGKFDALTNRHFLWTLRDPENAVRNWRALLRPGGRLVAIDGFWFKPDPETGSEPEEGLFERYYTRETRRALPGWRHFSPEPWILLLEQAGFRDVSAVTLDEIHRLAENPAGPTPPYALTAIAP
jgi:SAM-dependent methyltransferase